MFQLMCIDFHISNCKSRFEIGFQNTSSFLRLLFIMGFWFQVGESRFLQIGYIYIFDDLLKDMLITIS